MGQRLGVPIEANHPGSGEQKHFTVATSSQGAIEKYFSWGRAEQVRSFSAQDGAMPLWGIRCDTGGMAG